MPKKKGSHSIKKKSSSSKKKKINLIYKIFFSVALIMSLVLGYFLILVSAKPQSIPFITSKIESIIQGKLGTKTSMDKVYISFTRHVTLKIEIDDLKVFSAISNNNEGSFFVIPKLEAELSLFDLLLMRFKLNEIKIVDSTIILDESRKFSKDLPSKVKRKDALKAAGSNISVIINALSSIREGSFPIKNFELKNAKLLVRGEGFDTNILIKKSLIRTSVKRGILYFYSENKASFDKEKSDVDFNSNCQLSNKNGLKCDLMLKNFVINSITDLHPDLVFLDQINTTMNASTSFVVKDGEIENISFKADSSAGSFEILNFFSQKIYFHNFSIVGKYDNEIGMLNLSDIKVDFEGSNLEVDEYDVSPHLEMSLLVSGLKSYDTKKMDFHIKVEDVQNNELDKFWPINLGKKKIRNWVISHVRGGIIKSAYAKFSLTNNNLKSHLNNMDSQLIFTGSDLEYSKNFPAINNLSGTANFDIKGMKISITDGDVLDNRVHNVMIAIDDFKDPSVTLKISGESKGNAADLLKHINYKSDFATMVEKYFNGDSQNKFDIAVPLNKKITLKNTYIDISSIISDFNSDYIKGDVSLTSKKPFNSTNFVTNINLTKADLDTGILGATKKAEIESALGFIVSVENGGKVALQNILLWQKEVPQDKVIIKSASLQKEKASTIAGSISFKTVPFIIEKINFKNDNFGKNKYDFSYNSNKQKISIKGSKVNLAGLLRNKPSQSGSDNQSFKLSQIQVTANEIGLMNNKSLQNFYLFLNCQDGLCYKGVIKGGRADKKFISLDLVKNPQEDFSIIAGDVIDVGYLIEALGLSNTISADKAKIKIINKSVNKKLILEGEIIIDSDVIIYENTAVKRLASDDLYSQIKDAIFSEKKTTFDSMKIKFVVKDNILHLKSLVANNYKIGITAKGTIDLRNNSYDIKGMIVPGFVINNLFGIGNIPILGDVISGLLTGGEGGGLFGIRYEYSKSKDQKEPTFKTNKVSSFVPTTIKSLFDLI